jgi:histidine decarboxylase
VNGLKKRVAHSLEIATYTEVQLNKIGIKAWRNPDTFTVVFPTPEASIKLKWQLASEDGMSHIICMPNVTKDQIDEFILDMSGVKTSPEPLYIAREAGGYMM